MALFWQRFDSSNPLRGLVWARSKDEQRGMTGEKQLQNFLLLFDVQSESFQNIVDSQLQWDHDKLMIIQK